MDSGKAFVSNVIHLNLYSTIHIIGLNIFSVSFFNHALASKRYLGMLHFPSWKRGWEAILSQWWDFLDALFKNELSVYQNNILKLVKISYPMQTLMPERKERKPFGCQKHQCSRGISQWATEFQALALAIPTAFGVVQIVFELGHGGIGWLDVTAGIFT